MDAGQVDTALAAKRQELKKIEADIAELEERSAAIGASNEAAQAERKPKFHAFDYMQSDVKKWEEMRNDTSVNAAIGGCGCSAPAAPEPEDNKKAAFMASEVEQWESMMKNKKVANDEEKEDEEES